MLWRLSINEFSALLMVMLTFTMAVENFLLLLSGFRSAVAIG